MKWTGEEEEEVEEISGVRGGFEEGGEVKSAMKRGGWGRAMGGSANGEFI